MKKIEYKKLNKAFKKKWLKALRSGEFRQTRESLKGPIGYCCLGVAASLLSKWRKDEYRNDKCEAATSNGSFLRPIYRNKIGLSKEAQEKLVALNDTSKKNFKQIADFIEENL